MEKVLRHKMKGQQVLFLTLWKGFAEEEATCEPIGNFIHRYYSDLVKYAQERNLMDLAVLRHFSALGDDEGRPTPSH